MHAWYAHGQYVGFWSCLSAALAHITVIEVIVYCDKFEKDLQKLTWWPTFSMGQGCSSNIGIYWSLGWSFTWFWWEVSEKSLLKVNIFIIKGKSKTFKPFFPGLLVTLMKFIHVLLYNM